MAIQKIISGATLSENWLSGLLRTNNQNQNFRYEEVFVHSFHHYSYLFHGYFPAGLFKRQNNQNIHHTYTGL
jgi:hypothetical protein